MTKPVTRKMAVDCLLWIAQEAYRDQSDPLKVDSLFRCLECHDPVLPGQPVQFDHRHAIVHEGPHEHQNLWPIHTECHKKKTARDIAANAKVKRLANPKPSKRPMKSSGRKIPSRPFSKRGKT